MKPIIARLNAELTKVLQLSDVKERLLQQGALSTSTTPEQAAQRINAEVDMWAKVIKAANIRRD